MKRLKFYDAVHRAKTQRSRVRDDDPALAGYDIAAEYPMQTHYAIEHAGTVYVVRKRPQDVGISNPVPPAKQTVGDRVARTIQSINLRNKAFWNQK
ncbi:hypothetical protein [Caballeronia sp. INSB1]|uniref:hypothetical protein n=1 Tax=Caballeronia sp. INSB1 TaxID=2921751 RepID=UPI002032D0F6|nr:hypothetical protein [Caballeronia sp. INSB1]